MHTAPQSPCLKARLVELFGASPPAPAYTARRAAQARERLLDDSRYVDVATGDPEKDYFSVGRMWLEGGG